MSGRRRRRRPGHRTHHFREASLLLPLAGSINYTGFIIVLLCFGHLNVADCQWPSLEVAHARFPGQCTDPDKFDCGVIGEHKCIPLRSVHDGVADCPDRSDEFCYPGQIRCGHFCANVEHLSECLTRPKCEEELDRPKGLELATIAPQTAAFCPYLKRKLCHMPHTLPCKGYGECILTGWLRDGKADCFDGSDEDPAYADFFVLALKHLHQIVPQVISSGGTAVLEPFPPTISSSTPPPNAADFFRPVGGNRPSLPQHQGGMQMPHRPPGIALPPIMFTSTTTMKPGAYPFQPYGIPKPAQPLDQFGDSYAAATMRPSMVRRPGQLPPVPIPQPTGARFLPPTDPSGHIHTQERPLPPFPPFRPATPTDSPWKEFPPHTTEDEGLDHTGFTIDLPVSEPPPSMRRPCCRPMTLFPGQIVITPPTQAVTTPRTALKVPVPVPVPVPIWPGIVTAPVQTTPPPVTLPSPLPTAPTVPQAVVSTPPEIWTDATDSSESVTKSQPETLTSKPTPIPQSHIFPQQGFWPLVIGHPHAPDVGVDPVEPEKWPPILIPPTYMPVVSTYAPDYAETVAWPTVQPVYPHEIGENVKDTHEHRPCDNNTNSKQPQEEHIGTASTDVDDFADGETTSSTTPHWEDFSSAVSSPSTSLPEPSTDPDHQSPVSGEYSSTLNHHSSTLSGNEVTSASESSSGVGQTTQLPPNVTRDKDGHLIPLLPIIPVGQAGLKPPVNTPPAQGSTKPSVQLATNFGEEKYDGFTDEWMTGSAEGSTYSGNEHTGHAGSFGTTADPGRHNTESHQNTVGSEGTDNTESWTNEETEITYTGEAVTPSSTKTHPAAVTPWSSSSSTPHSSTEPSDQFLSAETTTPNSKEVDGTDYPPTADVSSFEGEAHSVTRPPFEAHKWAAVVPPAVLIATLAADKYDGLDCKKRVHQWSRDLVNEPNCECPAGQMKTSEGVCARAPVAAFSARVRGVCGDVEAAKQDDAARIAVLKLANGAADQACVRERSQETLVMNTVCDDCNLADIRSALERRQHDLPDIDVDVEELSDASGQCSSKALNDCDEGDCYTVGLMYECHCPNGTIDVNGDGRACAHSGCKRILGICLIIWIILLFLLFCLLPCIVGFACYRCGCTQCTQLVQWYKKTFNNRVTDVESGAAPTRPTSSNQRHNEGGPVRLGTSGLSRSPGMTTLPDTMGVVERVDELTDDDAEQERRPGPSTGPTFFEKRFTIDDDYTDTYSRAGLVSLPSSEESMLGQTDDEAVLPPLPEEEHLTPSAAAEETLDPQAFPAAVSKPRGSVSAESRSGTPTIWEKFQILGQQYAKDDQYNVPDESSSLDSLFQKYQEIEFEKFVAQNPQLLIPVEEPSRNLLQSGVSALQQGVNRVVTTVGDTVKSATSLLPFSIPVLNQHPIPPTPLASSEDENPERRRESVVGDVLEGLQAEPSDLNLTTTPSSDGAASMNIEEAIAYAEQIAREAQEKKEKRALQGLEEDEDESESSAASSITPSEQSEELFHLPKVSGDFDVAELVEDVIEGVQREHIDGEPSGVEEVPRPTLKMPIGADGAPAMQRQKSLKQDQQSVNARAIASTTQKRAAAAASRREASLERVNQRQAKPAVPAVARRPVAGQSRVAAVRQQERERRIQQPSGKPPKPPAKTIAPTRKSVRSVSQTIARPKPMKEKVSTTSETDEGHIPSAPGSLRSTARSKSDGSARRKNSVPTRTSSKNSKASNESEKRRADAFSADVEGLCDSCAEEVTQSSFKLASASKSDFMIADIDLDLPGPHMVPASLDDIKAGRISRELTKNSLRDTEDAHVEETTTVKHKSSTKSGSSSTKKKTKLASAEDRELSSGDGVTEANRRLGFPPLDLKAANRDTPVASQRVLSKFRLPKLDVRQPHTVLRPSQLVRTSRSTASTSTFQRRQHVKPAFASARQTYIPMPKYPSSQKFSAPKFTSPKPPTPQLSLGFTLVGRPPRHSLNHYNNSQQQIPHQRRRATEPNMNLSNSARPPPRSRSTVEKFQAPPLRKPSQAPETRKAVAEPVKRLRSTSSTPHEPFIDNVIPSSGRPATTASNKQAERLEEKVHEHCLRDRPPWDNSPLRNGDFEKIPLDWNLIRVGSSSNLLDSHNRSRSYTNLLLEARHSLPNIHSDDEWPPINEHSADAPRSKPTNRKPTTTSVAECPLTRAGVPPDPSTYTYNRRYNSKMAQKMVRLPPLERPEERRSWMETLKSSLNSRNWLEYD